MFDSNAFRVPKSYVVSRYLAAYDSTGQTVRGYLATYDLLTRSYAAIIEAVRVQTGDQTVVEAS